MRNGHEGRYLWNGDLLHIPQQLLRGRCSTQGYARSATGTPLILMKENQRLPRSFNEAPIW